MKNIAMAMHVYHDTHGRLPPAAVRGKDGKPLLSWRVLILPFLEQQELYNEFKLDEPWDSPHNIRLLSRRPSAYAPPGSKAGVIPGDHTLVQVFVGKGTIFENPEGAELKDVDGGTNQTILFVEGGKPVPWTKPEDLSCAPDKPLPDWSGPFQDFVRISFADGHDLHMRRDVDVKTMRSLISRRSIDKIGIDLNALRHR
jgi:hypothetical protein